MATATHDRIGSFEAYHFSLPENFGPPAPGYFHAVCEALMTINLNPPPSSNSQSLANDVCSDKLEACANSPERDALFDALHDDDQNEFLKLLEHPGIDISARNHEGSTALHVAAALDNSEAVSALVAKFKDYRTIDARDRDGMTALMVAASAGHFETVKVLLEWPTDVSAQDWTGTTALMHAITQDSPEMILRLREAGADMELTNNDGWTALRMAVHTELQIVEACLQPIPGRMGPNIHATNDTGQNALMYAAEQGMFVAMTALISHGADVNAVNDFGESALMAAARRGYELAIGVLLEAGASAYILNHNLQTALDIATVCNQQSAIVALTSAMVDQPSREHSPSPPRDF